MTEAEGLTVKELLKEIRADQKEHRQLLQGIHEQVQRTNGRVTALEKSSIGAWAKRHPVKMAVITAGVVLFLVSDTRHLAFDFVKAAFGLI